MLAIPSALQSKFEERLRNESISNNLKGQCKKHILLKLFFMMLADEPSLRSITETALGDAYAFLLLAAQRFDMDRGAEDLGAPPQHAQRVDFIGRGDSSRLIYCWVVPARLAGSFCERPDSFLKAASSNATFHASPAFWKRSAKARSLSCSLRY